MRENAVIEREMTAQTASISESPICYTRNPNTGSIVATFPIASAAEVSQAIEQCDTAFRSWRWRPLSERLTLAENLADQFLAQKGALAELITLEMGKPIRQSEAEIQKCADACRFYARNGGSFLAPEPIEFESAEAFVRFDPVGIVLAIMPWNFPFWQLIRPGLPAIIAGNCVLLKHAPNVPQCALAIEQLFLDAGFPSGVLKTILTDHDHVPSILEDDRVQAVTLTGSERAGAAVAALAGRNIKRSVLELGGSDPFIVCADADLDLAVGLAVRARYQNAGQSCIAAKRFLIARPVYESFIQRFSVSVALLAVGDPMDRHTDVGPLARLDLVEQLDRQVRTSEDGGARVVTGGKRVDGPGYFYSPTILAEVPPHLPIWQEETFGPVAAVVPYDDDEEAIAIANAHRYGLGATLCTQSDSRARNLAARLDVGMVFVNALLASDARLPFGGVKKSGYGRELSRFGAREFTNVKTVVVSHSSS
jgi:succinate-semialdehyde dehydrogenase/glutarate-semialdehyde dehydrogenase